jgi:hypothetical protein
MNFPEWLCGWIFEHALLFRWADYMNDVSGLRCRCGKENVVNEVGYTGVGGRQIRRDA